MVLTYADTRMRNGSHESNSASRFLREIDARYLDRPVGDEDDEDAFSGFGASSGFGLRFGQGRGFRREETSGRGTYRYGASGPAFSGGPARPVAFGKPREGFARPEAEKPAFSGKAAVLNRPLPPKIPDAEFVPVPMSAIKVGQRIEHNRFGGGLVEEITGTIPELKARINFDAYGVKIILLKYAKLRFETQ